MKLTVQARFKDDHWNYLALDRLNQTHFSGSVAGVASFHSSVVEMLVLLDIRHTLMTTPTADPITFEIEVP